jgi:hypothetical protein
LVSAVLKAFPIQSAYEIISSFARQRLGEALSATVNFGYGGNEEVFSRKRIKPNCSIKRSLSSRQRILLRERLTEPTDSEGSDKETRGSEEDAGQKRSRTVKSEVVNL